MPQRAAETKQEAKADLLFYRSASCRHRRHPEAFPQTPAAEEEEDEEETTCHSVNYTGRPDA